MMIEMENEVSGQESYVSSANPNRRPLTPNRRRQLSAQSSSMTTRQKMKANTFQKGVPNVIHGKKNNYTLYFSSPGTFRRK